jgi:hypothetical protein
VTEPAASVTKQKVLVPEDFPSLITAVNKEKAKTVWQTAETSLAETVKDHLENDTVPVRKTVKMVEDFYAIPLDPKKEKRIVYKEYIEEEELPPMIPLSAIYHRRNLLMKRMELLKKREIEEEEAAYRWQMSKRMIPPQPEPPMKHYDETEEEDEEEPFEEEGQEETSRRDY